MEKFVSLHLNSEYSILQSTIKINNLIDFALKNGLKSLVLTDHNVMSGVAEFIHKCTLNKIKPIVGVDLDVEDFRLILLAKNYEGYCQIIKLSSEKMHNKNIVLKDIDSTNIFIIDHPTYGYYQKFNKILKLKNFYIGTTKKTSLINAVYVNDTRILYSSQENDVLNNLYKINHPQNNQEFNLKPYILEVDQNDNKVKLAMDILNNCNVDFTQIKLKLPNFKISTNTLPFDYLKNLVAKNAQKILKNVKNSIKYQKRISYELSIINKLDFANYFLIIYDIVNFAKSQQILVGPGRGSVSGSLIAYLLNITEVDPLKFNLLFERFLNPERVTMPDIDLDFQDNRRDEVLTYIFNKYGKNNVGLISTFQRFGPKMALRDVAKNMKIHLSEVETITKTIPNIVNAPFINSLNGIYQNIAEFRAMIDKNQKYTILFENAKLIEGLPRQHGTHAAGIVISDVPLNQKVPTLLGPNNLNQVQFPMDYLEEQGLLKIDILGLKNLTIIQNIQEEVQKNHGHQINLKNIPLNDNATNELLTSGDTNGVFQLESYGMRKTLGQVGISSVDDVTAVISLYRPGPMQNIPLYIAGKQNHSFTLIDRSIDDILKSTYGIIVYQEQIMEIVKNFSGMSFAKADIFRRAIGKKDAALLHSLKTEFFEKASEKNHNHQVIEQVYDLIAKFANFGFNKSHAVAYAILSYRLAYLKARFPLEFYTSLFNSSLSSTETIKIYVNEVKRKYITVIGPNINLSKATTYNNQQAIILPFTIIKGVGLAANNKILEARNHKHFTNLFDVVVHLKLFGLGEATIKLLIKANAFRDFANMETCLASLALLNRYATMVITKKDGQKVVDYSLVAKPELVNKKRNLKNEVKYEQETLGLQINAFLTLPYEKDQKLAILPFDKPTMLVVLFEHSYRYKTKNNEWMGNITCSDSSQSQDISVFPNLWKNFNKNMLNKLYKVKILKTKKDNLVQLNLVSEWKEVV